MSSFNSKTLPDNIRRRIEPETRRELQCPTQQEADAKFSARKEKKLQENVAALLRQRDIAFFCQRMDKRTSGTVGWPDFTFAVRGLACAVECKSAGGALTGEQQGVVYHLMQNGWRVLVCRSEDALLQFIRGVEHEAKIAEGRKAEQALML